jgi:hypothetical protein
MTVRFLKQFAKKEIMSIRPPLRPLTINAFALATERTKTMADFDIYQDAFPHAEFARSPEGVLEVVLHTNGGMLIFNGYTHEEFVELFHKINQDAGNRVVILTGAGEAFIDSRPKVSISSRRADTTKFTARARRSC